MLIVLATVTVQPDKRQAFVTAAEGYVAITRGEPGCIAYDCHQSVTDPDKFVFVERWESQVHMEQHSQTPEMAAFMGAVVPCVAGPPVIEAIEPASVRLVGI
jgi:quinol monooxygenase YgiN